MTYKIKKLEWEETRAKDRHADNSSINGRRYAVCSMVDGAYIYYRINSMDTIECSSMDEGRRLCEKDLNDYVMGFLE